MSLEFTSFDIAAMTPGNAYKLLSSVVVPRPIAWIVSQSAAGHLNAAPFSFFNLLSSDPPVVGVGFSTHSTGADKDTYTNILETEEFTVHIVTEETAEAMNITAVEAPHHVNEIELAGLTLAAGTAVKTPRIVESPAALECRLLQTIQPGASSKIVLGQVVHAHVLTQAFYDLDRLHLDADAIHQIGRMQGGLGGGYTRTRDKFDIKRPVWKEEAKG
ncbi:flavin reductase family protein [Terriglobus tenax]|uniref:flavin reductase family protein n=1 Tax=Terriglobus tenax TaxID=1111115 RepID=UPI0021E098E1|nr:flavin reductase family protein [Terriglobus tenax]